MLERWIIWDSCLLKKPCLTQCTLFPQGQVKAVTKHKVQSTSVKEGQCRKDFCSYLDLVMKLYRWCSSLMWYVCYFYNLVHVNHQLIVYHRNKCHQETRWYVHVFLGPWYKPLVLSISVRKMLEGSELCLRPCA